jgi:hypothetical protein
MAEAGATILRCEQAEQAIESVTIGVRSSAATDGESSGLCGRPGVRFGIFNDRPAFETSVARRFVLILATDTIDESHVKTGKCPCHGRIKLRTTHRDLPGSRQAMYPSRQMRPNPSRFIETSHYEFYAEAPRKFTDTIIGGLMVSAATYRNPAPYEIQRVEQPNHSP